MQIVSKGEYTAELVSAIARACHEANRHYCRMIGDPTQEPWDSAPDWQRRSCIDGVVFHLSNPNAGPSASHENWIKEKERDGWKYGPVKDAERKEHPCFVPYDKLPEAQRVKDMIFSAIVAGMAA